MKHRPTYCLAVLLALILASPATAMAEGFAEVYRDAVEGDPELRAAEQDRLAVEEARPQARALQLPNIGAGAAASREFAIDTPTASSDFNSYSYSLNLTQPLYRRSNQVTARQAEARVSQADAGYDSAQQELILRTAQAYFGVLSAINDLTFAQANREAIARQLEQARRRFEVGLITITDVYEAQAREDLAISQEIAAANAIEDAYEALRQITGRRYGSLNDLLDDIPLDLPAPTEPEVWVQRALENNPDLQSNLFGVEVTRENIELQRSGHYPTVDLVAGYADRRTSGSGRNDSRGGTIGVQVAVPIYQGGAVDSRTRQAAYEHEAARERLESAQRGVAQQVRSAYRGLETAISQIRALDQARVSNRSALEATEAGFEVGTRTIVDVLNAQQALFGAERDYQQSRYDYVLNRLRLFQAAGDLDQRQVETVDALLQKVSE